MTLTKAELECLRWIALGKTARETGIILDRSAETVRDHLASVRIKLECSRLPQAVARAYQLHLL